MVARAPLLLALVLATTWARASPAAITVFNDEAQAAVREYGIPSQISSKVELRWPQCSAAVRSPHTDTWQMAPAARPGP